MHLRSLLCRAPGSQVSLAGHFASTQQTMQKCAASSGQHHKHIHIVICMHSLLKNIQLVVGLAAAATIKEFVAETSYDSSMRSMQAYDIIFKEVAFGSTFHQCIYLLCEQDERTVNAGCTARRLCGTNSQDYMPHLSLLYSDFDKSSRWVNALFFANTKQWWLCFITMLTATISVKLCSSQHLTISGRSCAPSGDSIDLWPSPQAESCGAGKRQAVSSELLRNTTGHRVCCEKLASVANASIRQDLQALGSYS